MAGVGVGALELIVVLEIPNVSKMSIATLLLALRRFVIEAVSLSSAVCPIRLKVTSERSGSGAGTVDT